MIDDDAASAGEGKPNNEAAAAITFVADSRIIPDMAETFVNMVKCDKYSIPWSLTSASRPEAHCRNTRGTLVFAEWIAKRHLEDIPRLPAPVSEAAPHAADVG